MNIKDIRKLKDLELVEIEAMESNLTKSWSVKEYISKCNFVTICKMVIDHDSEKKRRC